MHRDIFREMPDSPDINKTLIVVRVERGLKKQFQKAAEKQHTTITAVLQEMAMRELSDIELTPEDYREIANEIEADRRKVAHRKGKHKR